ncbi:MAG: hypothetical protein DIJKHBIC_02820 [Thermoanaerobaculia bacterium]|nr:hypothetical protein [Thermoanaerobaculia bacterium]
MKRNLSVLFVLLLSVPVLTGCRATNSTEVGVKTSLIGIFGKRGTQTVYAPGSVYMVLPFINAWTTLPTSQQNLMMNANPAEGDRAVPDDITFKTKDGNNIYIDVNVMFRVDPQNAGFIVSNVGNSIVEIKERIVRPISRSVIRDVFNEISSEEYYQVSIKNKMAAKAKDELGETLKPYGILVDMLQVQQHRFDPAYQAAINAQKQAEADRQKLVEQQKNMEVQKQSELEAKRAIWNQRLEEARGEAGRARNAADGYYQVKINEAKAILARAQAESEGIRKEAEALGKMGGDAFVKMQVAKQLAQKKILIVPGTNVSTMNVNDLVNYMMGRHGRPPEAAMEAPAPQPPAEPQPKPQ